MKTLTLLTAVLTFFSCNHAEIETIHPNSNALIFGDPFSYGVENMLLFPIGTNYTPEVIRKVKGDEYVGSGSVISFKYNTVRSKFYDTNASAEYQNLDEEQNDIRNILFYNKKTGKSYPLFVDTLHILSFSIHNNYTKPLIFYRVVKHDMNGDSMYTKDDPVMLYISDIYGAIFTQITPSDEQFMDYTEYPEDGMILVKTCINSDDDLAFTTYDETNFREVQLSNPQMGREIFTPGLKDSLRAMIRRG